MKKRILSILLVVAMLAVMIPAFAVASSAETTVTDWDADVIILKTPADFKAFHDKLRESVKFDNQTVKLAADMDMKDTALTPLANGASFLGTFDGQFHTISNVSHTVGEYVGALFGNVAENHDAVIMNLSVKNFNLKMQSHSGVLYGAAHGNLTVKNVYINANLQNIKGSGTNSGGFLGRVYYDKVTVSFENCVFDGTYDNSQGGYNYSPFVGLLQQQADAVETLKKQVSFTNCLVTGTFTRGNKSGVWLGGANFCNRQQDSNKVDISNSVITFTDCIQYVDYFQNDATGRTAAVSPKLTGLGSGFAAFDSLAAGDVPAGYTAINTGYPVPTTLLPFFADKVNSVAAAEGVTTKYDSYQDNGSMTAIRLIGAVIGEADDFTSVGFEIAAVGPTGVVANFEDNVTSVYTSVEQPSGTVTAESVGANYFFVSEIAGIKPNAGVATFAVKTYSVDTDGNKTYTDMYIISFDTTVEAN